tara:strand:- start:980 stop:1624 length:645 start_codon:yes stop_codon:yes gene_type:complete
MATLDLNIFPYEIYVNTSLERPYHPKCDCICKDILVQSLNDLLVIENFDKYDCYITGKVNSSSPYPTFDCDLILTKIDKNDDEILQLFKNIKLKGFERNINFDLKYMSSIEPFSNGVDNPDDLHEMSQTRIQYDLSQNEFTNLLTLNRPFKIRKKRNIEYTYHKPLLIKNKDSNTYNQDAIDFINNSVLPNSSEKNSTFQYTIPWKNYINTTTE